MQGDLIGKGLQTAKNSSFIGNSSPSKQIQQNIILPNSKSSTVKKHRLLTVNDYLRKIANSTRTKSTKKNCLMTFLA